MLNIGSEELYQTHINDGKDYGTDPQEVTVSGPIRYVGPDMFDLPCIELGDEHDGPTRVNCVFKKLDYDQIPEHGHATITGTFEGCGYGQAVVKQARLVSTSAD